MQPQSLKKALLAVVAMVACGTLHGLAYSSASAQDLPDAGGGMSSLDAQLSQSINAERTKAGLRVLFPQEELMRAAQYHAQNMADQGILTHDELGDIEDLNDDGRTNGGDRLLYFEYRFVHWLEIIASRYRTPSAAVAGWMKSDAGHREAILNAKMGHIGVGVATGAKGTRYYCAVFAVPRQ